MSKKNSQNKQLRDITSDLGALRKEIKEATKQKNNSNMVKPKRSRQRRRAQIQSDFAPIGMSRPITSSQPVFNGGARVSITHKEFIKTLNLGANPGFQQLLRLRINPGSKNTFSWLSSIAPNFEFFRFRKIKILYETRTSTVILGSVIISPDYDASDGQLVTITEQSLFNNIGTHDDALWKSGSVALRPDLLNRLYSAHVVMTDDRFAASKQDEKTIDPAQVFVYADVDPTATNANVGKVYVEYSVDLWSPQSRTEDVNQGGGFIQLVGTEAELSPTSSRPFVRQNDITVLSEDNILKPLSELAGINLPTAVIGQFARDYQGTMSTMYSNSSGGLNGVGTYFVGSDPNSPAGTGDDVLLQKALNQYQAGNGNAYLGDLLVKGLKGQFLKHQSPTFTTPAGITFQSSFGGSTLF